LVVEGRDRLVVEVVEGVHRLICLMEVVVEGEVRRLLGM